MQIEDNGHGIKEENLSKVFNSFYTTKEVGEGTGLGLSVSYFIITEQHKGKMAIEHGDKTGTKVIILLK